MSPKRPITILFFACLSLLFLAWVTNRKSAFKNEHQDISLSLGSKSLFQYSDEIYLKFMNLEGFQEYLTKKEVTLEEAEVLKKTLKFMVERRDEEDPELIAFVKTLIIPPFPESERSLTIKGQTDFSQIGQSKYFDEMLKQKRNGFYVEAGGYDGQTYSNSLFFELERGWNGILIEAIKPLFKWLIGRKRHAYSINACIADKVQVGKMLHFGAETLSGLDMMGEKYKERGMSESGKNVKYIFSPCFSLVTILKAIDVNKVDYFSLDVEGAECLVLDALNFKKLDITSFSIEHNLYPETLECIRKKMLKSNYNETLVISHDVYYKKI